MECQFELFVQECSLLVALYSNIEELPVCQAMSVHVSPADQSIQGVALTSVGFLIEPAGTRGCRQFIAVAHVILFL